MEVRARDEEDGDIIGIMMTQAGGEDNGIGDQREKAEKEREKAKEKERANGRPRISQQIRRSGERGDVSMSK